MANSRIRRADVKVCHKTFRFTRCMDCGRDTGARGLGEYPLMLRDDIWESITAVTDGKGVLCRRDMERRLGRALIESDMM